MKNFDIESIEIEIKNNKQSTTANIPNKTLEFVEKLKHAILQFQQQKDIETLFLEQQSKETQTVNNISTPTGEGATTTSSVSANTSTVASTTSSVSEGSTSTFSAPTGGGVANVNEPAAAATSSNTTPSVSEAESTAAKNNSSHENLQPYANVASQESISLPQHLQENTGEPTLEQVKKGAKDKLNAALKNNDASGIKHWTDVLDKLENGASIADFKDDLLFKEMYNGLKLTTEKATSFNWDTTRGKLIAAINEKILNGEISQSAKSHWLAIQKQLKDENVNIANLFEEYDELFLLLREIEGLTELPSKITFFTKTKVYPNLSADKMYATIGTNDVYTFLKSVTHTEIRGAGVKKGAVSIKNSTARTFIAGEILEFEADASLINSAKFLKEDINWVVYLNNKLVKIFKNEGTTFSYNFDKAGSYIIEAYGNKSGANTKKDKNTSAYVELVIIQQEVEILAPATFEKSLSRPFATEKMFTVRLKANKLVKPLQPISGMHYEIQHTKGKITTNICDPMPVPTNGFVPIAMPLPGKYTITVTTNDQYAIKSSTEFSVLNNYVTAIEVVTNKKTNNVYLKQDTPQKITLEVKEFKMQPTAEELANVKWLLYNNNKNLLAPKGLVLDYDINGEKKPFITKGKSFDFILPTNEGNYLVEAYSNTHEGKKSKSSQQIQIVHPTVTEANWTDASGNGIQNTGFGSTNYIKASIPNFCNQKVRVFFYLNNKKEYFYYSDTTTNDTGEINKLVTFDKEFKERMQIQKDSNTSIKVSFMGIVDNELYSFKNATYKSTDAELKVTTKKQILDLYFEYNGKRVLSTDKVPYGAKTNVKLVAITQNMIGEQLKFGVTKYTKDSKTAPLEYDGDSILEEFGKATVKSNGIAEIGFVINKGKLDKVASYMASIENYSTKHIKNKMLVLEVGAKWQQPNGQHGIDVNYFLEKYKGVNESNLKILLNDMNEYYTINKITPMKEQVAYILATVAIETGETFKPIKEDGSISYFQRKYDPVLGSTQKRREDAKANGNKSEGDGVKYRGRGYVQLTWKKNYQKIKDQFGVDIVTYPDKALEPKLAAKTLIWGMEKGMFTGVGLNKYINYEEIDYVNARRIVNSTDRADDIAEYAINYEKNLKVLEVSKFIKPTSLTNVLNEMKKIADNHLPYAMEENTGKSKGLRTDISDNALSKMDCSEFVCRYLQKLGITNEVKWVTTGSMTTESSFQKALGTDKIKLVGNTIDFIPQKGDIFVWRFSGGGHTGIVYDFNQSKDIVTILEAIGGSGSRDDEFNKKNGGYTKDNCTRTSFYQRKGKALFAHDGFIGYFRPKI